MESSLTRNDGQQIRGRRHRFVSVSVGLLLCLSCSRGENIPFVRLSSEGAAGYTGAENSPRGLRLAVSPMISPAATAVTYQPLVEYLSNRLERPVSLVQRRTYGEINELIRVGRVEFAFVCSGAYVEGHGSFGMELLAAPVVDGKSTYRSYILVGNGVKARSFADLQGKRFAFTDILSNTGFLYPMGLLRTIDPRAASFFSKVIFTHSHDRSIQAVADQLVDAAAVDSLVYNQLVARNKTLATKTRIIARSAPFGIPPIVVHPNLRRRLKEKLRVALLAMGDDPAAAKALAGLGISRFVGISDAAYDSVRTVAKSVRGRGGNG